MKIIITLIIITAIIRAEYIETIEIDKKRLKNCNQYTKVHSSVSITKEKKFKKIKYLVCNTNNKIKIIRIENIENVKKGKK